jgi:hypothetical protein
LHIFFFNKVRNNVGNAGVRVGVNQ